MQVIVEDACFAKDCINKAVYQDRITLYTLCWEHRHTYDPKITNKCEYPYCDEKSIWGETARFNTHCAKHRHFVSSMKTIGEYNKRAKDPAICPYTSCSDASIRFIKNNKFIIKCCSDEHDAKQCALLEKRLKISRSKGQVIKSRSDHHSSEFEEDLTGLDHKHSVDQQKENLPDLIDLTGDLPLNPHEESDQEGESTFNPRNNSVISKKRKRRIIDENQYDE